MFNKEKTKRGIMIGMFLSVIFVCFVSMMVGNKKSIFSDKNINYYSSDISHLGDPNAPLYGNYDRNKISMLIEEQSMGNFSAKIPSRKSSELGLPDSDDLSEAQRMLDESSDDEK